MMKSLVSHSSRWLCHNYSSGGGGFVSVRNVSSRFYNCRCAKPYSSYNNGSLNIRLRSTFNYSCNSYKFITRNLGTTTTTTGTGNTQQRRDDKPKRSKNDQLNRDIEADLSLNSTKGLHENLLSSFLGSKAERRVKVDEDWVAIYRFGHVRTARVIQRLKLYQTGLTCCLLLPGSFGYYMVGAVSEDFVAFLAGCSIFACGMLYVMGNFCSRLIGTLYVSKTDPSMVRVAHMNFWGNREDQLFQKSDFIPLSELPDMSSDAYVNVKFYSDPENEHMLRISFRYGHIFDKEEFEEIFGSEGLFLRDKKRKMK